MRSALLSALAAALIMTALDLVWLGIVAKPFYDTALGSLRAANVNVVAAATFYFFYLSCVYFHAVWHASTVTDASQRGAGMGLFAYATYELTNWAVITDWPARLVFVDIVWGVLLTAATAAAARWTLERTQSKPIDSASNGSIRSAQP